MDRTFSYLAVLLLVYLGATSLANYIKLRRENYLFPSKTLYPGSCSDTDCLDPDGYIEYILPKLLIMFIGCLLGIIFEALLLFVFTSLPGWVELICMGLELAMFIWLMIVFNRAAKRFW